MGVLSSCSRSRSNCWCKPRSCVTFISIRASQLLDIASATQRHIYEYWPSLALLGRLLCINNITLHHRCHGMRAVALLLVHKKRHIFVSNLQNGLLFFISFVPFICFSCFSHSQIISMISSSCRVGARAMRLEKMADRTRFARQSFSSLQKAVLDSKQGDGLLVDCRVPSITIDVRNTNCDFLLQTEVMHMTEIEKT